MILIDFILRTASDKPGALYMEKHLCSWQLPQAPAVGEDIILPLNRENRDKPPGQYRVVRRYWRVDGSLDNNNPNSYSTGILYAGVVVMKPEEL